MDMSAATRDGFAQIQKWHIAFYGALGSFAPDILLLYSKRFSQPDLVFSPSQYFAAMSLYVILAALVSSIYPYKGRVTAWKAFLVGATLPIVVSAAASVARPASVSTRGLPLPGTLLDLLALL